MTALVGYTGFVGGNICAAAGNEIDAVYNTKNIKDAYGTKPDLLIYAGLRAEKYLANSAPEKDMELIIQAEENIRRIAPEKLVLISTIDVFKQPKNVDEASEIDTEDLHAYGYNRYQLEAWVRERYPEALVIRLPGLFGRNLKKNFIYDYINVIPSMLKEKKMEELSAQDSSLKEYYVLQNNGFYRVKVLSNSEKKALKEKFNRLGFSALHFTDSRSRYQFYNLANLWGDMQTAIKAGLRLWHPAVEPVSAGELYHFLTGDCFVNELAAAPADYNYKTIYDTLFGGKNGYISDKKAVLMDIKELTERWPVD